MTVQRDCDRRAPPHALAQRGEQPALRIILAVRDGRAMEHEVDAVDRIVGGSACEPNDLIETLEGERLPRRRPRRHRRHDLASPLVKNPPGGRQLTQGVR